MNEKFKLGKNHKIEFINDIDGKKHIVETFKLRGKKFAEFLSVAKKNHIELESKISEEAEIAFSKALDNLEYFRSRISNRGYIDTELVEREYNYRLKDGDIHIDGEKHLQLDRSPSIYFDDKFKWNYIGFDFSFMIPEDVPAEYNTIRYSGFIKLQNELFFEERFIKTIYVFRKKGPKRNDIFKQTIFEYTFKNVSDSTEIQNLIDSYYSVTMKASEIGKLCSETHLQNEKSHRFTQNIRQWISRGHFESKGKEGRENTVDVSDVLNYLYKSNNQNNLESLRNFIHNDKGIIIPI